MSKVINISHKEKIALFKSNVKEAYRIHCTFEHAAPVPEVGKRIEKAIEYLRRAQEFCVEESEEDNATKDVQE